MERVYAWQAADWPGFKYDAGDLQPLLADALRRRSQLDGLLLAAGLGEKQRAEVLATAEEAVATSEIEGENLDPEATRSSVALQLGIEFGGARRADRKSEGVVSMLVDAAQNYDSDLTKERLCYWQSGLFVRTNEPGRGRYRALDDGPEQVVRGPYGKQRVLYEAPPGDRVSDEMAAFLAWFNSPVPPAESPVERSALAHLWFVTIHPFVDGNGRVARAISDLTFARAERSGHRYFSMSAQIRDDRDEYEEALQSAQRGKALDATEFVRWFASEYARALDRSLELVQACMSRSLFWGRYAHVAFNERQRKMLSRFLGDWEGNLTAGKWANSTGVSEDTAQRDLQQLVNAGVLKREGAGRGTHYVIATGNQKTAQPL